MASSRKQVRMPGSTRANYGSQWAAEHLKVIQPLLDLLHGGILKEVLAVICALMYGYGRQIAVLQPKVLWYLQQAASVLSPTVQSNALPSSYTLFAARLSSVEQGAVCQMTVCLPYNCCLLPHAHARIITACLRASFGISPKDIELVLPLLSNLRQRFPEVIHLLVGLQPLLEFSNI